MSILLIGCGHSKAIRKPSAGVDYSAPVTLDIDESANPDMVWDLNKLPYPFEDDSFDELHAYDVLEHCGLQGDWRFFFGQFDEFYRVLKPGGKVIFSVPQPQSMWAFGDPGHTRIIHPCNMTFLDRSHYGEVGSTSMTDYRKWYKGNFIVEYLDIIEDSLVVRLRAMK